MMRNLVSCVTLVCATVFLPGAHAEIVPSRGATDSRVRVVAYDNDNVVVLRGFVGYQIHLQFAEGEQFINLGAGDTGGLDVGSEKNHLMIKPKVPKVATNLTIITTQRVYQFEYSAEARVPNPRVDDVLYSLRFIYPKEEAARAAAELQRVRAEAVMSRQVAERARNWNYWFCGNDSVRPTSAFDDGVHTRVKFGARSEFPALFVKNDDGSESLLNFNVENDEVVIHRVAREFVIRRGKLVGCIQNRSFDGGGTRLESGTVVPGVNRAVRGGQP
jgi:type IV secretion system protein VirB9